MIDGIPPDGGDGTLVLDAIARQYGIRYADLVSQARARKFVVPRHEAMRVLRDEYGWHLSRIAKLIGGRNHCTVIRGIEAARERAGSNHSPAVLAKVLKRVAQRHCVTVREIRLSKDDRKSTDVVRARQEAMLILRERYGWKLQQIGGALNRTHETVRRGIEKARRMVAAREAQRLAQGTADPKMDWPIGSLPPSHPFYELDQQMLRARTMRHRAEGGWRQSSLADAA